MKIQFSKLKTTKKKKTMNLINSDKTIYNKYNHNKNQININSNTTKGLLGT